MSFSSETKIELCQDKFFRKSCCRRSFCYGFLLFATVFSDRQIKIQTENEAFINRARQLLESQFGIECHMIETRARNGARIFSITVSGINETSKIFEHLPQSHRGAIALSIDRAALDARCDRISFLRGAFVCAGFVTPPDKDYHLEYSTPHRRLAQDLTSMLTDFSLTPKSMTRGGNCVVYYKESESVEDMLSLLGATSASLRVMEAKVVKDVRNNINRRVNFETANLTKTVTAASAQIDAIKRLVAADALDSLSEPLREAARLRLDNPHAALSELCEMSGKKISRSSLNRRLARVLEIAGQLNK